MRGYGTWMLAQRYPQRFAAVMPVCGGGDRIRALLPSWRRRHSGPWGLGLLSGAKDSTPLSESERMVEAFKRTGVKDIELTVYPEANHDSWTETYNNPKVYEWLLQHSR